MIVLIIKNMATHTMYIAQEVHTFLKSFNLIACKVSL